MKFRSTILVLATVSLLAASVLPACAEGLCCPVTPDAPMIHAAMPCCAEPAMTASRDLSALRPAADGLFSVPVATIERLPAMDVPSHIRVVADFTLDAPHEPSPPLFLLNEQFLI